MLPREAQLMRDWIARLGLGPGSVCLNLGSSTRAFREEVQPFIAAEIVRPLERAGVRIIHCDMKADEGVDEVGDLLDPTFQAKLRGYEPDLIICSNILEHLTDPATFARACGLLAKPGGHCLFTVPRSFPYHPDPLDTMFRPAPAEIAALLPAWTIVDAAEIEAGNYRDELKSMPGSGKRLAKQAIRALLPFWRPAKWRPAAHQLLWLFRPYRVSAAMLRKPEEAAA